MAKEKWLKATLEQLGMDLGWPSLDDQIVMDGIFLPLFLKLLSLDMIRSTWLWDNTHDQITWSYHMIASHDGTWPWDSSTVTDNQTQHFLSTFFVNIFLCPWKCLKSTQIQSECVQLLSLLIWCSSSFQKQILIISTLKSWPIGAGAWN